MGKLHEGYELARGRKDTIMAEKLMYYVIHKGSTVPYIALAKRTPFIEGEYITEWGVAGFEIGETKEKALNNLKNSLPGNDWVEWEKKE